MKKRGRKALSRKVKTDRLYEAYKRQYNKAKEKYGKNIGEKLNKTDFLHARQDALDMGYSHATQAVVQSQKKFTEKQSRSWAKKLGKNIEKWKTTGTNTEFQQELLKIVGNNKLTADYFYKQNRSAAAIISLITQYDSWEEAVGS